MLMYTPPVLTHAVIVQISAKTYNVQKSVLLMDGYN
jgi:hypothetical protein